MRTTLFFRSGSATARLALGAAGFFAAVLATAGSAGATVPTGACCVDESCLENYPDFKCAESLGTFQGDGTTCKEVSCSSVTTTTVPEPVCGNEEVEYGETCDDGNTDNSDGCDEKCQIIKAVCGNKEVEDKEECDDGNTESGDGCTDKCFDEYCGDGKVNDEPPVIIVSGHRHVSEGEECDDGGTENGDGCNSECKEEFCGDGVVNDCAGARPITPCETCDDGGTAAGDGCNSSCQAEFCGDGITNDTDEECDDGGSEPGDGCDGSCKIEPPTGACCKPSGCYDNLTAAFCAEHNGSYGGDGSSCEDPGICAECGDGAVDEIEACDDANTEAGDGCDASCNVEECWTCNSETGCSYDDGAECDDEDECTVGDTCGDGECTGTPPIVPAACRWVMVGGDDQRDVQSRTRDLTTITGDICGETTRVGESTHVIGDVVATQTAGLASTVYAFATVDGDILTGGGSISGKPKFTLLPGLDVDEVPGGSMAVQSGDPDDVLDARGGVNTDPRVTECAEAIDSIDPSVALIEALPATQSLDDVRIGNNQTRTITASVPGGLNVVDILRVTTGNKTTLELDGAGDPDTVFILRVDRKFYLRFQSQLALTNGTQPGNVIIYGAGLCKIGEDVVGGGLLLCPNGKLKMEENSTWGGALIAGRKFINVRHKSEITHIPLTIAAP